jgi:hypothetical protein
MLENGNLACGFELVPSRRAWRHDVRCGSSSAQTVCRVLFVHGCGCATLGVEVSQTGWIQRSRDGASSPVGRCTDFYQPSRRVSPKRAIQSRSSSNPAARQHAVVRLGGSSIGSSVSRKPPNGRSRTAGRGKFRIVMYSACTEAASVARSGPRVRHTVCAQSAPPARGLAGAHAPTPRRPAQAWRAIAQSRHAPRGRQNGVLLVTSGGGE